MIKNSVLTFILRLRAKNYVRAFWYKMRKLVWNIWVIPRGWVQKCDMKVKNSKCSLSIKSCAVSISVSLSF